MNIHDLTMILPHILSMSYLFFASNDAGPSQLFLVTQFLLAEWHHLFWLVRDFHPRRQGKVQPPMRLLTALEWEAFNGLLVIFPVQITGFFGCSPP